MILDEKEDGLYLSKLGDYELRTPSEEGGSPSFQLPSFSKYQFISISLSALTTLRSVKCNKSYEIG